MNANPWAFAAGQTVGRLGAAGGNDELLARLLGGLNFPSGGFSGPYSNPLRQASAGAMAGGLLKGLF